MRYLFLILLLSTSAAKAENFCSNGIFETIAQAYPRASMAGDEKVLLNDKSNRTVFVDGYTSKCKVWPAFPNLAIIAIKADVEYDEEISREAVTADLEIFIVSLESKKIITHYIEQDALFSDAVYVSSIELDTANYKLNNSLVAFGLRVNRSGSSSVNPFHFKTISLYSYENSSLKKVLDNMIVSKFYGEYDGNCRGSFTDSKSIIIVKSKKLTSGFFPLVVKTTKDRKKTILKNGDCVDVDKARDKQVHVLKSDGIVYNVPKEIKFY